MTDLAAFDRFKVDGTKKTAKELWTLKPITPMWEGVLLAFDQSIAACGAVHMESESGKIRIVRTWTIKTETTGVKGMRDTLPRSSLLFMHLVDLVTDVKPDRIAHEMPLDGGSSSKIDSSTSVAAAVCVRNVASILRIPVTAHSNQTVKKRLTGNGNAEKKLLRAPLEILFPEITVLAPNNEATRDAIGVGIIALEEKDGE